MGISRAWLKCVSQACCSSLAYQASFSVSACPAHQSMLDQLVEWLGLAGQQPPSLCVLQWKQHPLPGSWGSLARGKEQLKHHAFAVSLQRCLHEAEKGRQELPVTVLFRDLPATWAGNGSCLALHRSWGAGKGKRRDSSIFSWLAKGVQLHCDSSTVP